jgi:hypothetical protein
MLNILFISAVFFACEQEAVVEEEPAPTKKVKSVGDANVTNVYAREESDGQWTFHVSVEHKDVNWYDYADGWDVVLPDGSSIKPDPFGQYTRHIRHPNVHEQPFTRTQKEIQIPEGTEQVTIRAHDKKDGWGGEEIEVLLNVRFGDKFSVKRAL